MRRWRLRNEVPEEAFFTCLIGIENLARSCSRTILTCLVFFFVVLVDSDSEYVSFGFHLYGQAVIGCWAMSDPNQAKPLNLELNCCF